jgi:hypothetical protein
MLWRSPDGYLKKTPAVEPLLSQEAWGGTQLLFVEANGYSSPVAVFSAL